MRNDSFANQIGAISAGYGEDYVSTKLFKYFGEIVREGGGTLENLIRQTGISPDIFTNRDGQLPYCHYIALLNRAGETLGYPDIGMRLGKRQAATTVHPTSVAMRNAPTLGRAFRFNAEHMYTYGTNMKLHSIECRDTGEWVLDYETTSRGGDDRRQGAEHALIGAQFRALDLSGGRAVIREFWFEHDPIAPIETYRTYSSAPFRFAQPRNRIIFDLASAALPVIDRDDEVYDIATRYIDLHFARPEEPLHKRVRSLLSRAPAGSEPQTSAVAAALGMHPRTFQRKLRDEGLRFDTIRDEMRRDLALRYLEYTQVPLTRIALMLGYNEPSAFSRSCQRWFACSPGRIRQNRVQEQRAAA